MAFVSGLKAINALKEKAEADKKFSDRPKIPYFTLKDGESKRVRFLQEIDEESPHYNDEAGKALILLIHTGPGPEGWKRKAQCTDLEGDGQCFPCEQREAGNYQDWKKKKAFLYVNVLENPGTDAEQVTVLNQSLFGNGIAQTLVEYASDEEMGGSITDREWKITRQGESTDTRYTATAYPTKEFDKSAGDYELHDLTQAVADVPYEQQEKFYTFGGKSDDSAEVGGETPKKSADQDFLGW